MRFADLRGNRRLTLAHTVRRGRTLDALEARRTLRHLGFLWGYPVVLDEVDEESGDVIACPSAGRHGMRQANIG